MSILPVLTVAAVVLIGWPIAAWLQRGNDRTRRPGLDELLDQRDDHDALRTGHSDTEQRYNSMPQGDAEKNGEGQW